MRKEQIAGNFKNKTYNQVYVVCYKLNIVLNNPQVMAIFLDISKTKFWKAIQGGKSGGLGL